MSEQAGLSIPYLSQVERNQANPTVTSLGNIAHALGVSLTYFLPEEEQGLVVTRNGSERPLRLRELPYRIKTLAGSDPNLQLEPLLITVAPRFTSEFTTHLGEEFLYVLSSQLILCLGEEQYQLAHGDSAQHSSLTPHAWSNPSDTETQLLWVGTPKLL